MKRITIAVLTLALIAALSGGAYASDLNGGLKDGGVFEAPKEVRWSGFYIGGSVGYGNANHELSVQRYNGTYCYDRSFPSTLPNGDPNPDKHITIVDPVHGDDPFGDGEDAHIDKLTEAGDCAEAGLLGTPTGLNQDGISEPHGNGADAKTKAWPEADHAKVDAGSRKVANLDGLNSSGIVGDVRIGADYQLNRFVVGAFGSYGFSGMDTTGGVTDLGGFDIEKGDEWSIGARAGILVNPRTLAYVLAAYTQTEYEFSVHGGGESASKTVDFSGITVGGGVEFAVANNVFLGIEGTHTFYGKETLLDVADEGPEADITGAGTRLTDEIGETKVMGTLKVKLNGGLFD